MKFLSVLGHTLRIPNLENIILKVKCYKFQCIDYSLTRPNLYGTCHSSVEENHKIILMLIF